MSVMGDHSDVDDNGDGEGVWSPDIEKCFREALVLFPPCGRRKHILQEEGGKMYGRNELIARYIRMQTGKIRSRKQVSSHIQVLARRKAKAESTGSLTGSNADLNSGSSSTSSPPARLSQFNSLSLSEPRNQQVAQSNPFCDVWADRSIVTSKIRLVEFSAFIEHRQLAQNNGLLLPVYEPSNQINSPMVAATNLSQLALTQQLNRASPLQGHPPLPHQQPQNHNQQLPFNINQQHHQQMNTGVSPLIANHNHHHHHQHHNHQHHHHPHQQPIPSSSGFTRHFYVKIDYRMPIYRQLNKLERINIDQIQDKFPENPGLEALYQRGPSDAFFLVKFWADINNDFDYNIDDQNSFFGFSCHFETIEPLRSITCSTKACSYGSQVVEKVEKIYGAFNSTNGRYTYNIDRSPMCEFMTQFIKKLRQLPDLTLMNRILENFTVLQLVTSETDILLCIAYVFEIGLSQRGSHHHVYKLTKIHDS